MRAQHSSTSTVVQANAQRIHRDGQSFFEVYATGFTTARQDQVWATLTDYGSLATFVPDLVYSRVISRSGMVSIVEQASRAGAMFFAPLVRMLVRIEEEPQSTITVSQESGDMQHYTARWELEAVSQDDGAQGTRIVFTGEIEPRFFIPAFIGQPVVQANVRQMVESVIKEIEGRTRH
ncbi:SRPBCC family protein [Herbaspirillum sp. GCM10030257]|uniref:SRPBCC family protein n=1 Tax=Herbaspirillum sp. GCM10030257 TaxID=3273393 RepID=UPI003616C311